MHLTAILWIRKQLSGGRTSHRAAEQHLSHQVLIDNAVASSKKGKDVGNEVSLFIFQSVPVYQVFG